MLFHTWEFLVFFIVVYAVYLALRPTKLWLPWLLVASYVFYGWWNPLYLILVGYSTLLDYVCVIFMDRSRRRRLWLVISLVNNLALLGFFKYASFITDNLNQLLASIGIGYALRGPDVLLPVGISFFTFQSMSYTIDFYRGQIERERNFVRFATFVSFFPQLVAGPIERARELLPQFKTAPAIRRENLTNGISLFITGLFKKIALASYLANYADPIFANPSNYQSATLTLAVIAFAWQIYFDFSGYTDMARGIAQMLGFRLMLNFNHPYLATGLRDFWGRWHISLSTWFRDYVYIPLGGNRRGELQMYRNLFLTMVLSGLWHGAAWRFVIWGALHGIGILVTRSLEKSPWYRNKVPTLIKQVAVFAFVCFAWIFFRAETTSDALLILNRIATTGWNRPGFPLLCGLLVISILVYQGLAELQKLDSRVGRWIQFGCFIAMVLYLSLVPGESNNPFIYFQF
ncbi:MAG: MBOAT family protein [Planctomycetaceae bacterium]|nr:MBOAT family protein [Planctomycetaceae bacterium]